MARLLADENVPLPVVEALRSHGHDVITVVRSLPGSGASDAEIWNRRAWTNARC